MLRAKLYMQRLQTNKNLNWDTQLPEPLLKEWCLIVKQINMCPALEVNRCVGNRDSSYYLITCSDASNVACGSVIYLLDTKTNQCSFVAAHCKLFDSNLKTKSIPTLECYALALATNKAVEIKNSLCNKNLNISLDISGIYVLTDSQVCLHWLSSSAIKFEKLQNLSVLVRNKLRKIDEICCTTPITFGHITGYQNPADYCTKPTSSKILSKSNFFTGPLILCKDLDSKLGDLKISLPNPNVRPVDEVPLVSHQHSSMIVDAELDAPCGEGWIKIIGPHTIIDLEKFSSLTRVVGTLCMVLLFICKLKRRIKEDFSFPKNIKSLAWNYLILWEQRIHFEEVLMYFEGGCREKMPTLVAKMNIYIDNKGFLRVGSKFRDSHLLQSTPILLSGSSRLTNLIVNHVHLKLEHSGLYLVSQEINKFFYIVSTFSSIKRILKQCVICKRFNQRPIKLNQNFYRNFRFNPETKAFKNIMMDYMGPFFVKVGSEEVKVWILIITCLYTRAINLKVAYSLDTEEFLRNLQMHIFENGMFSLCISDLGSQLTAGANIVQTFLDEAECRDFLENSGISAVTFQNYPKGNSALGSLVETLVKQVKHLIYKSVRNVKLNTRDFELLVSKAKCIINKRPVAFRESLNECPATGIPTVITPEMLIRGYDACSLNILPGLQPIDDGDDSLTYGQSDLRNKYDSLLKVKCRMNELYHSEFLRTLIKQAVDKPDRYKKVAHFPIKKGDIVLLCEKLSKRSVYPLGRVISTEINDLGEVTSAKVFKGDRREVVYRHSSSLIPLLQCERSELPQNENNLAGSSSSARTTRQSSVKARSKIKTLTEAGLV